jgi:hypothetical protein
VPARLPQDSDVGDVIGSLKLNLEKRVWATDSGHTSGKDEIIHK